MCGFQIKSVEEMVGVRDRRGQEQKATRKWKDEWMAEVDRQGDKVGDWAQHADIKRFRRRSSWAERARTTTGDFRE